MTKEEALGAILIEAERINAISQGTSWFLFGSAIGDFEHAADIDILVLCQSSCQTAFVRRELREICRRLPFHLFLVTEDEEAELSFIKSEGCVRIFPLFSER
jgi:predicted nucleotidyltransferase